MLKVLLLSLSRQYTVDGQYIPSLFIEPEVRHDKTSYRKMTISLDLDQDQGNISPDLDPNHLQSLSADDKSHH